VTLCSPVTKPVPRMRVRNMSAPRAAKNAIPFSRRGP